MNILCTICSDLVNPAESIFVTKCGHIFHQKCLEQWIGRSKTCPQCRRVVTERCMYRAYPTLAHEGGEDAVALQSRLDNSELHIRELKHTLANKDQEISQIKVDLKKAQDLLNVNKKKLSKAETAVAALKEQAVYLKLQSNEADKLKQNNQSLKKELDTLKGLQQVLNATSEEVEQMLQSYSDLKTMATFTVALKGALHEAHRKKRAHRSQLEAARGRAQRAELLLQEAESKLLMLEQRWERERDRERPRASSPTYFPESPIHVEQKTANEDSPYLQLRQGHGLKPSEFALVKSNKSKMDRQAVSIFDNRKRKVGIDTTPASSMDMDTSYDGLGGHSKPDVFPEPRPALLRNCVPKLTSKHKLRRPNPTGLQDITKFIDRLKDKY